MIELAKPVAEPLAESFFADAITDAAVVMVGTESAETLKRLTRPPPHISALIFRPRALGT